MRLKSFVLLLSVLLSIGIPIQAQNPNPSPKPVAVPPVKIHVYIIGVMDFAIQDFNVAGLKDAVTLECNDIEGYFQDRFKANVEVKKYCSGPETTREAIRRYLSSDLRNGGADDLNFVFLMSHGIPISYANQFLGTDLEIVTSDTKLGDEEFTSISAATELLPWLQKLSTRSTTLVFLDVCYAGSANSLSTKLAGTLQQLFGIKNLVIASSLASDKSYQAAFTAAIMSILRGGECIPAQDLDRKIADAIPQFTAATLTGSQGFPDVIIPYVGSLCLGNLGEDGKLMFVYTGQEPKTTKYRIAGTDGLVEGPTYIENPFFARRENSGKYTLYIQRAGGEEVPVKTIDLTTEDFDVAWIDENVNYASAAEFLQKAADITRVNGDSPDTAAKLRLAAAAIYRSNKDIASYTRVFNSIPDDVRGRLITPPVMAAAFNDAAVQELLKTPGTDSVGIASQLALAGDFKNAARAANVAAAIQKDSVAKKEIQETEYLFLGASGNLDAAKGLREQKNLTVSVGHPGLVASEQKASVTKAPASAHNFQNLSALSAITQASKAVVSSAAAAKQ